MSDLRLALVDLSTEARKHSNTGPHGHECAECQHLRRSLAELEQPPFRPVSPGAKPFEVVRVAELREIAIRRKLVGEDPGFETRFKKLFVSGIYPPVPSVSEPDPQLLGVALSGGGIRSATFSLGILQALAHLDLLKKIDYLSTVSGGGYIGAWLASWIKRNSLKHVTDNLNPEPSPSISTARLRERRASQRPIRYLRQYSNYLTPQLGILSGDTWAMVAIYMRNTSLNLLNVVALFASALLVPRVLLWSGQKWASGFHNGALLMWEAAICGMAVLGIVAYRVREFTCKPVRETDTASQRQFEAVFSVPRALFLALLGTALWAAYLRPFDIWSESLWSLGFPLTRDIARSAAHVPVLGPYLWYFCSSLSIPAVGVMFWLMGALGGFFGCFREILPLFLNKQWRRWVVWALGGIWLTIASLVATIVFSFMNRGLHNLFVSWTDEMMLAYAPPVVMMEASAVVVLFIGLLGRYFPDARREWIGRLGGWLLIASIAWTLFGTAVFFVPEAWKHIKTWPYGRLLSSTTSILWAISVLLGVLAAKSPRTSQAREPGKEPEPSALETFTGLIPYVFLVGVVVVLSLGIDKVLQVFHSEWEDPIAFGIALACYFLLSLGVDINEFSMHHFYKNRLVRCYLGASNANRHEESFTGFDARDDIRLAKFAPSRTTPGLRAYEGPYPIINAALNMTSGEDLAYQERQADSFIFTPLFCGVSENLDAKLAQRTTHMGYRPTTVPGISQRLSESETAYAYPKEGIHVGSAISISGAAASPNWGYHTTPAVAFLLSVFNVRLGWWLGNPRGPKWEFSSPQIGAPYELKELFGFADPNSNYVYLSDGGHFENLGIYELVRRRCRFIVACDGEEDHAFGFEGLGNAIRKVRADFGIDIDVDLDQLRPADKISQWHCVVGKVHYEQRNPDDEPGILLYIKASLTGDEPGDILQYALRNAEFPHQSTGDQWFDESQFESYRKLGYHIGNAVFGKAVEDARNENVDVAAIQGGYRERRARRAEREKVQTTDLFNALHQRWFAPSDDIQKSFSRYGEQFDALMHRLESDKNLRFLDWQFYPGWSDLDRYASARTLPEVLERAANRLTGQLTPESSSWLPNTAHELRAGFYFANSLFQLMENVYLDLNLEESFGHPDNRGWKNLFQHWAASGMVRVAWAMSAPTFGARFQNFCRKELELPIGEVEAVAPLDGAELDARETTLLNTYTESGLYPGLQAFALRIRVGDLAGKGAAFVHRFGFVLIEDGKIVYLRIRRQFRTMGLARRSLNLLRRSGLAMDLHEKLGAPRRISQAALSEFRHLLESVRQP